LSFLRRHEDDGVPQKADTAYRGAQNRRFLKERLQPHTLVNRLQQNYVTQDLLFLAVLS
jgi:hypothetical protein